MVQAVVVTQVHIRIRRREAIIGGRRSTAKREPVTTQIDRTTLLRPTSRTTPSIHLSCHTSIAATIQRIHMSTVPFTIEVPYPHGMAVGWAAATHPR